MGTGENKLEHAGPCEQIFDEKNVFVIRQSLSLAEAEEFQIQYSLNFTLCVSLGYKMTKQGNFEISDLC